MATETTQEDLARRIARSLIEDNYLVIQDVWSTHWTPEQPCVRDNPVIKGFVFDLVIKRVKRLSPAHRGILLDKARFTRLPYGYFLSDTTQCSLTGRNFQRDACVAAITSEMLEIFS